MCNISIKVDRLIKKHNSYCPFEIAECENIIVIKKPLGSKLGMYRYMKKHKVIFLNSILNKHEQKIVLAHELGHAILHTREKCFFLSKKTYQVTEKFEIEADKFASYLLINNFTLDYDELNYYSNNQISTMLGVPIRLVNYKFPKNNQYSIQKRGN